MSAVRLQLAPIMKGQVPDLRKVRKSLADSGLKFFARESIEKNLNRTVRFWDEYVYFTTRITVSANQISAFVYPKGSGATIWKYVSRGTASRIRRIGKKAILMRPSFIPKTSLGSLDSGPGYLGAPAYRRSRRGVVTIPGIEARMFEEQVIDLVAPTYRRQIDYYLWEATQKSSVSVRSL